MPSKRIEAGELLDPETPGHQRPPHDPRNCRTSLNKTVQVEAVAAILHARCHAPARHRHDLRHTEPIAFQCRAIGMDGQQCLDTRSRDLLGRDQIGAP